jgi:spoIIIJ-associated protein
MRSIEISGRTVAEAVEQALSQLRKDRDEVMIEVVRQDATSALVRVSVPDEEEQLEDLEEPEPEPMPEPELEVAAPEPPRAARQVPTGDVNAQARRILEDILERMGVEGFVTPVRETVPGPDGEPQDTLTLHIEGTDEESTGLLIGRRGETLHSLQYLLNLVISRRTSKWPQIVIDVGNYRQRRKESLEGLARRIAERVRQSGIPLPLEPMSGFERRIVHLALRADDTVYTESAGEGENRKIVIYPSKGRP